MGMFSRDRKRRQIPGLNTASLPDLIFTMLFFFMIVTNMRESNPKSDIVLPKGENLNAIHKSLPELQHHIYLGLKDGKEFLQLDDKVLAMEDLEKQLVQIENSLSSEYRNKLVFSLSIDENIKMKQVAYVKHLLQKQNISVVNYIGENKKK